MFSVVFILLVVVYYSEAEIQLSGSVMIVRQVETLKCGSDVNLLDYPGQMVAYHQWNQVYPAVYADRFISYLRAIEASNTVYTVELQKFDNNTNIYSSFSVYNASNGFEPVFNLTIHCSGVQRTISLVDDDFYQYQVDHIYNYVDSETAKFSCLQYLHLSANIQIGWINMAGDRIFIYNQTEIILKLADVHNGSMLCCVYYTTSRFKNGKHIQRFVKDLTLLIYKEIPNNECQPSGTTTLNYCESDSHINITETSTTITNTSKARGKNSNTTNKTGKTTASTNEIDKNTGTRINKGMNSGTANETGKNTGITNNTSINSGSANETGKNTGTTNETGHKLNTTNTVVKNKGTTNETDKNTGTTNETSHKSNNTNAVVKNKGTTNQTGKSIGTTNETGKNTGTTNETAKITSTTNETGKNTGTTNETGKNTGTTNETGHKSNTTNATVKNKGITNRTDSSDHDADTDNRVIIISSISAIILLLLVGICANKKRCWNKTNRPERAQLPLPQIPGARLRPPNDEPNPNTPFYLNLLFRGECEREIQAQEEPLYEEIMYQ